MSLAPLKQTLPDERLTQQQFDILFRPAPRRQRLQKHHDLLKVHLEQLIRPFDEEGRADI